MSSAPASHPALQAIIDRILRVYGSWSRDTGIERMRADWEALFAPDPALPTPEPVDGAPAAWIGAPGADPTRAILYLHGGGFQIGSLETHRAVMAEISRRVGCRVLGVDYRLAPEHRFPAQLEDALGAHDWLRAQGFPPDRIALAGDSSGAGLAVSLLLALKARGDALPAGAALMSPWTDMEASGDSYTTRAEVDPIHQRPMIQAMARAYLGRDGNPRDPLASPIHGDLAGLPPLLVQVGGRETLLDDARVLALRAREAGVDVTLEVSEPMIHVFQLYADDLAEAREALDRIGAFLRRRLGRCAPAA